MTNSRRFLASIASPTSRPLLEESDSENAGAMYVNHTDTHTERDDSTAHKQNKPHRSLRWAWNVCLVFGVVASTLCAFDFAARLYAANAKVSIYVSGNSNGGRELVTICRLNSKRDVPTGLSEEDDETARTGIVRVGAVSFAVPTSSEAGADEEDEYETSECHQELRNPNEGVWGWVSSFVSSSYDVKTTTTSVSESEEATTSTQAETKTKKTAKTTRQPKTGLKLPKVVTQWGQKDKDGVVSLTLAETFQPGSVAFCGEEDGKTSAKKIMNMIHGECLGENEKGELQTMPCSSPSVLSFCIDRATLQLRTTGGKCMGIRRADLTVGEAPIHVHECGDENHVNEWQFAGWFGWHVYNAESRMCWDVLHQNRNGTIIQWRCKLVTDYKPPNQWFVWME